jgi:hypothetical protein
VDVAKYEIVRVVEIEELESIGRGSYQTKRDKHQAESDRIWEIVQRLLRNPFFLLPSLLQSSP